MKWKLGIGADSPERERLLTDCRAGKIDAVMTRSIRRFCLDYQILLDVIKELSSLTPPMDVYFMLEQVHSTGQEGELLQTYLKEGATVWDTVGELSPRNRLGRTPRQGGVVMGRDIHVVLEKKTADGWEFFNPGFAAYDRRNYSFFDFLEEVAEPDCLPELDGKQLRPYITQSSKLDGDMQETEYFVWDTTEPRLMYGFGQITLEKLIRETRRFRMLWVSAEFWTMFCELGGVLPTGMYKANDPFDDDDVGFQIVGEDEMHLRKYIRRGILDLTTIAREHQLEYSELRICFAFDC